MSRVTASIAFSQMKPEDTPRFMSLFAESVVKVLNGGVDFDTNFNGKIISITFTSGNTDTSASHTLGRTPTGYIPIGTTAAMDLYDGSTASTDSVITLRSSAAGTARLLIF